jgi:hypothetical protein
MLPTAPTTPSRQSCGETAGSTTCCTQWLPALILETVGEAIQDSVRLAVICWMRPRLGDITHLKGLFAAQLLDSCDDIVHPEVRHRSP